MLLLLLLLMVEGGRKGLVGCNYDNTEIKFHILLFTLH